ncbi:uncharacterized protein SPAPADRAFT_61804 [Spathaspora passalidarum NRRL Y-27907]|uniref:FCP1 homology domain-containing protein n=1 Tax=Spathaspora passalidarum (strain NRRL Y-27907 / 11-Y1) TaxID=619300 RepID=G3AR52_SPAPN|nr:uncharacterized protein SPAPADRAFT_61804 [Spathaspora passalidarum NRRL Y-27907]EGW31227.1 hypothetical protein SPAPADRAFT_61804 [Spathaspora passalidarum NRRL Y-27907]
MGNFLMSIFCCAGSSRDEGDDKIQSRPATSQNQELAANNNGASAPAKQKLSNSPQHDEVRNSNNNNNNNNDVLSNGSVSPKHVPSIEPEIIENDEEDDDEDEDDDVFIKKSKITKKDLLDDEHSETDTITNTNDSNNTPQQPQQENSNNHNGSTNNTPDKPIETSTFQDYDNDIEMEEEDDEEEEDEVMEEDEESYLDLTKLQEGQAYNPETGFLLGHKDKNFNGKKCLVLDLDETLVHSSFKYLRSADFVIPVEIDNQIHHVYVIKRPGVDEFLQKVGQWFEVVVFTASVAKYGDPLLDKLDLYHSVHHRLFRDSCYNYQGNFIKNLSQVGRPLTDTIIIDNSPASYIFHPQHSVPISSWFSDTHDNELLDLLPLLKDLSSGNVDDVGMVLDISL